MFPAYKRAPAFESTCTMFCSYAGSLEAYVLHIRFTAALSQGVFPHYFSHEDTVGGESLIMGIRCAQESATGKRRKTIRRQ